jgi:Putative MetA-pathway of phenol degradation
MEKICRNFRSESEYIAEDWHSVDKDWTRAENRSYDNTWGMFSGFIRTIGNINLCQNLYLKMRGLMEHGRLNILKFIFSELIFFLFIYSIVIAQTKDSTPFVPDRPGFATPPDIITRNIFEVEEGIQYENSTDGIMRNQNLLFSSLLLRYGLAENAELRIQTDYAYNKKDSVTSSVVYGLNPMTIGTKVKLVEQQKVVPNFSLLFNLTLPFIGKNEFRPENVAPSFYLLMSNDLSETVNLCYNYGMIWDGSSPIPTHFFAVCLGVNLNNELSTFIESYGFSNQPTKPEFYIDAGLAYLITDHLQIDLTAAGYLNSFKDYYLINIGLAWEINK